MVSIKDIAREVGVSASTVSRALTGNTKISSATRNKIIGIARSKGYLSGKPQSLMIDSLQSVGLIISEVRANYYVQLIASLESKLRQLNYSLLLGLTGFSPDVLIHYLKLSANKRVNGIICECQPGLEILNELQLLKSRFGMPVVLLIDRDIIPEKLDIFNIPGEFDTLVLDDDFGIRQLVKHLIDLGHRDIALIGDIKSVGRKMSFLNHMQNAGVPLRQEWICLGEERFEESGYLRMKEILQLPQLPTAVIATYDAVALGAMRAIQEAGLRIPEDLSLTGYDNGRDTPYLARSLTSVNRVTDDASNFLVNFLMNKISNKNSTISQNLIIRPELVIRESTGRPRLPH